jgi:hypothetical protein
MHVDLKFVRKLPLTMLASRHGRMQLQQRRALADWHRLRLSEGRTTAAVLVRG